MRLTESQQAAVEQRGSNLLVAASAGSGKTEVLARRCLSLIADPQRPCGIDQVLVVTFTRAAAAELRARVGQMLRKQAAETRDQRLREHLRRQEVLVDTADIGTIDAWCARVVREHFAATKTGIDPAFAVLGEQQAALLRTAVVDELFDWVYTADDELAAAARDWILRRARPSDDFLRGLVLALNAYREHLINPDAWFERQLGLHRRVEGEVRADAGRLLAEALSAECGFQQDQLAEVLAAVRSPAVREQLQMYREALASWRAALADAAQIGPVVAELAAFRFPRKPRDVSDREAALREEVKSRWLEKRLKKHWNSAWVENVLAGARPTAELLVTLLRLEDRYRTTLDAKKRAQRAYEFADVLRMALDLLGTPAADGRRQPTPLARALQRRYEHILVDEYQDTSPVQVELLRLVTRSERGRSNRFMVGDVKQSIYGFRRAEPRLFADLIDAFSRRSEDGRVLLLADNFRSHPDLLEGLNQLFALLFDPALGGTGYSADERLSARREEVANPTLDAAPRIELQLMFKSGRAGAEASDEPSGTAEEVPLEQIEREARVAGRRIHALLDARVQIPGRDPAGTLRLRPLRLADIVILLRSAKGNAPLLAAALRQTGIPCAAVGRESILDSLEVQDVCGVLALLANRQQDVPLAAYLRGPLVGLSAAQLLEIRRASSGAGFYGAVEQYRSSGVEWTLAARLDAAMEQLDRWTAAARTQELSTLVRQILRDTRLVHLAQALPGGEQRVAMLRALESLATEFAERGQPGVAEFVEHLEALGEQDVQPAATAATGQDVVRIMTIHAAKGLEFPVVFLLGTGAAFSHRPRRGDLLCDERRGVGIEFFDYPARKELVNAAFGVNRQAVAQRELEEELRLLYVAATRAREQLVIVGHTPEKTWSDLRGRYAERHRPPLISRLSAGSMLEWVMMSVAAGRLDSPPGDAKPLVRVEAHAGDVPAPEEQAATSDAAQPDAAKLTDADRLWIERGRAWLAAVPDTSLAQTPAVLSVSAVKQQAARTGAADVPRELDFTPALRVPRFAQATAGEDGRTAGNAYHRFMQQADLKRLALAEDVQAQVARLVADRRLSSEEAGLLSPADIVWFANTDEGRLLAQHADACRREVPFVYALPVAGEAERIVLRGVIDCLLETREGLLILDYKTDRVADTAAWDQRISGYGVQLQLYALAAAEVFGRPVSGTRLIFLRQQRVVRVPVLLKAPPLETLWARVAGVGESGWGLRQDNG